MMAAAVVALLKKVEAPVLPNSVWLEPPPKAAPMSAPLPVWSKTIIISAIQTRTCIIISRIVIVIFLKVVSKPHLTPKYCVAIRFLMLTY